MEFGITYYQECLNESIQDYLVLENLHPVLEEFKSLIVNIDIESNSLNISSEIQNNLLKYWTNPDYRKEEINTQLDGILLEYNSLDEIDSKVFAYGLIDLKSEIGSFQDHIKLEDYDFCNDFQSLPGFNLSISNDLYKLHWESLQDEYPNLEIYFAKGWNELMTVYKNVIYLSLSKAFKLVEQQ